MQGFVDDDTVNRLILIRSLANRLAPARLPVFQEDLALSSDDSDLDYAGWQGPRVLRQGVQPAFLAPLSAPPRPNPGRLEFAPRRAAPPEVVEPGLELSYRSGHRWWLAVTAGVVSCLLFASIVLALAQRTSLFEAADFFYPAPPPTPPAPLESPTAPAPPPPLEITSRSLR
ncbi:MAG: hypothetical protein K9N23_12250 [Akkermansiaceae bacterium]|nr:hypothetical protein [Akkermansiaceae bacterium]